MCPHHMSSLRLKIIFISLLWKKFEMDKIIKATTEESEPRIRRGLMHPPKFAFLDTVQKIKV